MIFVEDSLIGRIGLPEGHADDPDALFLGDWLKTPRQWVMDTLHRCRNILAGADEASAAPGGRPFPLLRQSVSMASRVLREPTVR